MTRTTYLPFTARQFRRLIIVGFGGPTVTAAKAALNRNIEVHVCTSERQVGAVTAQGDSIKTSLEDLEVTPTIINSLKDFGLVVNEAAAESTAILSVGSPFIFKQDFLDLFPERVFNSHGAPLPLWRGGGGYSWRILAGDRRGRACIHLVTTSIDDGDIVYQQDYTFPDDAVIPGDYERVASTYEVSAIEDFIERLCRGEAIERISQDESASTYFPRLHTPTQAWINWDWTGEMVERFIHAFSHPYPGARSYVNDTEATFYRARFEANDLCDHPFFNGLVSHIGVEDMSIACPGGWLRVPLSDFECAHKIAVGDRFRTPASILETAMTTRPVYTPTGLKSSAKE